MSSPILPIKGPSGPSTLVPPASSGADPVDAFGSELAGAFGSQLGTSESTLAIAASRGGPPPEVLDQIAAAGRIEEQLRASSQQLRFLAGAPGERTSIEIHDREGAAVRSLSVAEALEIAAGKPLE